MGIDGFQGVSNYQRYAQFASGGIGMTRIIKRFAYFVPDTPTANDFAKTIIAAHEKAKPKKQLKYQFKRKIGKVK